MLCLVFTKHLHCGLISQVLWFVQMHHFRDERLSSKNQKKKKNTPECARPANCINLCFYRNCQLLMIY